jgi:hypothetical protein
VSRLPEPDPFTSCLQLSIDELSWEFGRLDHFAPSELGYLINPRRLRGSDFLMRWSQGRWSEELVIRALSQTTRFGVLPYGPSTVAPEDPSELERFFDTMDRIAREGKRPDLLLYDRDSFGWASAELQQRLGSVAKMAETPSDAVRDVIVRARAAVEIENSLWVTEKMPGFGKPLLRYLRGKRRGQIKPPGVIPTIIVKQEDIPRLRQWEADYGIPIYVVHVFYDRGYFIKFQDVLRLLESGDLGLETQRYSNPDGTASSPKQIVKVPYSLCREFGTVTGPTLVPRTFVDKNGKVMTYVTFSGGDLHLSASVFAEWGGDA